MKTIKYIFVLLLILQSCNFEDLVFSKDDDSDDEPDYVVVKTYEYDKENDILTYLEDDVEIWKEYYDFEEVDGVMKPVFAKRVLSSDIIYEYRTYRWDDGNPVLVAYYDLNGALTYFDTFKYDENDKVVLRASYNSSSNLDYIDTVKYNDEGTKVLENKSYDSSDNLTIAKKQVYSDDDIVSKFYYNANSGNSNHKWHSYIYYDNNFKYYKDLTASMTEAYGTGSGAYLSSLGTWIHYKVKYGEENTTSRNTENLVTPVLPAYPTDPDKDVEFEKLDLKWMTLKVEDSFGETVTYLNSDFKPTQIRRSAPDHYEGYMYVYFSYTTTGEIKSKTTKYKNYELLKLELDYNDTKGYLDSLTVSGKDTEIPTNTYSLTYYEENIPKGLRWELAGTVLFDFIYEYKEGIDLSTLNIEDINSNITSIKQYQGEADKNNLYATYDFVSDELELILNVSDKDSKNTGKIILGHNDDSTTAYLKSFGYDEDTKDYFPVWDYNYTYADFEFSGLINELDVTKSVQTRLTEFKNEYEDGAEQLSAPQTPESITGIDIETLLLDIKNLLPIL